MLSNLFGKKETAPAAQPAKPKPKAEGAPSQPAHAAQPAAKAGVHMPQTGAEKAASSLPSPQQAGRPDAPAQAKPASGAEAGSGAGTQAPMPQETSLASFQSVVDEAAIIFSSGDEATASDILVQLLNQTKGNVDKRVWYMLLDMYHAMNRKDRFDQLSLHFANRFGTSPPPWDAELEAEAPSAQVEEKSTAAAAAGKNVLIVEGPVSSALQLRVKDFIAAAREMKTCKIDISRLRPANSDKEGFTILQGVMATLRKYKVAATLMGENHLADWLKKKVAEAKNVPSLDDSPYWLLLLEILQWRGLMEEFEDLSLDYTITYELSGPGWETGGVMTVEAGGEEPPPEAEGQSDAIVMDSVITDMGIHRLQDLINLRIAEKGSVSLDFHKVKRMDFSSAGAFLAYLSGLGLRQDQIIIIGPTELILALMDVVGLTPYATIVPRKR